MVHPATKQIILQRFRAFYISKDIKVHDWFKGFGNLSEIVDFTYWWSCIWKGVQQVCLDPIMVTSLPPTLFFLRAERPSCRLPHVLQRIPSTPHCSTVLIHSTRPGRQRTQAVVCLASDVTQVVVCGGSFQTIYTFCKFVRLLKIFILQDKETLSKWYLWCLW